MVLGPVTPLARLTRWRQIKENETGECFGNFQQMKALYLDIFSGISGDMFLGAMLDLGLDAHAFEHELEKLGLHEYHLHVSRQQRGAIAGTKFDVHIEHEHEHSHGGVTHSHPHTHGHAHEQEHHHEHEHGTHDHDHDHLAGLSHGPHGGPLV